MANKDESEKELLESFVLDLRSSGATSVHTIAMSSASPIDQYGNNPGGSVYGSGQSDSAKSPLSASLGFLKSLTEKKSTRGKSGLSRTTILC